MCQVCLSMNLSCITLINISTKLDILTHISNFNFPKDENTEKAFGGLGKLFLHLSECLGSIAQLLGLTGEYHPGVFKLEIKEYKKPNQV